jgi:hypothetical protein
MPSAWVFDQVHAQLVFLWNSNCEIFTPNKWAAPAVYTQSFVNGAIGTQFPSRQQWIDAYRNDPDCTVIWDMVLDPSSICKETLKKVHYAYHHHLCQSHIAIKDDMLILQEPICGSTSHTHL